MIVLTIFSIIIFAIDAFLITQVDELKNISLNNKLFLKIFISIFFIVILLFSKNIYIMI